MHSLPSYVTSTKPIGFVKFEAHMLRGHDKGYILPVQFVCCFNLLCVSIMTPDQRFFLFTRVCLPLRLSFAILARTADKEYVRQAGLLALLPAIGFWLIWLTGIRPTSAEGGGSSWWNALRPVHGTLYALFAWAAMSGNWQTAWVYLLVDVMLGAAAWVVNKDSSYNT